MIKTKSFELAEYIKGDPNSDKLAIVIPGRLDTKDYAHNMSLVDYLAGKGYLALSFDPPGTWESAGEIDIYTTTNYIKAVNELIEYFGNKPTVLAGHSRGGSVAMLSGPNNPHVSHIVAIFSNVGPASPPGKNAKTLGYDESFRDLPPGTAPTDKKKVFKLPLSYFEDGQKYNALPGLKVWSKPKLFFYGTEDVMAEPGDVQKAYESSAEPKEIHEIKSKHDYRYHPTAIKEINESIGRFLDTYHL